MVSGIHSFWREPCIFIGGPLDGVEDLLYCLGRGAPCDEKTIIKDKKLITYRLRLDKDKMNWEKIDGKWALYYMEEDESGLRQIGNHTPGSNNSRGSQT